MTLSFRDLPRRALVRFRAERTPARALWVNFELARAHGFSVPEANRLLHYEYRPGWTL